MVIIPKEDTKCRECMWSTFLNAECVLASGYICKLNPFKNVAMGLDGIHYKRKMHIEDEKEEEERKNKIKGSK